MATTKYVHFYDEGPGYLFVAPLGSGAQGATQLVRGIADGRLYVRKTTLETNDRFNTFVSQLDAQHKEVSLHRPHSNIPRLVWHTPGLELAAANEDDRAVTIWEFCNGGDLKHFFDQFHTRISNGEAAIPEAVIWRLIFQICRALDHVHSQGIQHNDVHAANIFLHWPNAQSRLPDFFLGDFGIAQNLTGAPDAVLASMFAADFGDWAALINRMISNVPIGSPGYTRDLHLLDNALRNITSTMKDPSRPLEVDLRPQPAGIPAPTVTELVFTRPVVDDCPALYDTPEEAMAAIGVSAPWYVARVNSQTLQFLNYDQNLYFNPPRPRLRLPPTSTASSEGLPGIPAYEGRRVRRRTPAKRQTKPKTQRRKAGK